MPRWNEISYLCPFGEKSNGHLQQSTEMKYQFIEKNCSSFPVKKMCQTLNVSPSGFYRWNKTPISPRKSKNTRFQERINEIFSAHKGMVGSPIVTANLHDDEELSKVSRPRVVRMMRDMGLKCRTTKKFVVTTDSKHNHPVAPNLLNRNFTVSSLNVTWVSDITYLKVRKKWHYLTVFIDLFSRIVVGWDNAVAESFFHSIKTQLIHHVRFQNRMEAEHALVFPAGVGRNRLPSL